MFTDGLGASCLLFNIINIKEEIVINEKIKSIILIGKCIHYNNIPLPHTGYAYLNVIKFKI